MRKFALLLIFLPVIIMICFSAVGCSDKKPTTSVDATDSLTTDTTAADTMETIISETPMPKAADELFDDFIFNFAANRKLQFSRIKFPLQVVQGKKVTMLEKKDWKMEHFFMRQGFYTLIFDNRRQMDLVKDTTVARVTIEKIYLKRNWVNQYIFDRINGQWMLVSMHKEAMFQNSNVSFLKFYQRFSTDSLYQIESMNDEVTFTAPDPDNDFGDITGTMYPDQWPDFKPALIPRNAIYNILYGQKYTESSQKIFVIRGIANGLETEMTFRRKNGQWKLMKFNY